MVSWSVLYEIVYWLDGAWLLLYWFMLLKVTGKILSDRNICIIPLFYRIYGNIVHIVIVTSLILLLSPIIPVIKITWILIDLNNNVIEQLIPRLGKLMEETASVFWVDLGYRLRSWDTVPLQGFGAEFEGWLISCIVSIVIVIDYLAVGSGAAPGDWAVVPGM